MPDIDASYEVRTDVTTNALSIELAGRQGRGRRADVTLTD